MVVSSSCTDNTMVPVLGDAVLHLPRGFDRFIVVKRAHSFWGWNHKLFAYRSLVSCFNPDHASLTKYLGDTTCSPHSRKVPIRTTVGAAVGGVVFGVLVALSAAFVIDKRRTNEKRRGQEREPIPFFSADDGGRYDSLASQLSPPADERSLPGAMPRHSPVSNQRSIGAPSLTSTATTLPQEYTVEPYYPQNPTPLEPRHSVTSSDVAAQPPRQSGNDYQDTHGRTTSGSASVPVPEHPDRGGSQVYVIHHDSGRAPVSVITSRGTEVVELPPGYSSEFLGERRGARDGAPAPSPRRQRKDASGSR